MSIEKTNEEKVARRGIGSPNLISAWSKEDGWFVPTSTIRSMIASGNLDHFKVGRNFKISYKKFCEYIGVIDPPQTLPVSVDIPQYEKQTMTVLVPVQPLVKKHDGQKLL